MLVRARREGRSNPAEYRSLDPYSRKKEMRERQSIPVEVLLERDRRAEIAGTMSLTARLLGDPVPGQSALDHRP